MRGSPAALAALLLASAPGVAEGLPAAVENTKISGYFFGDAYGVLAHHDPAIEGENGFWFRRVYLTFDTPLDDNLSLRLRFEANSPGDFGATSENLEPYLKDLYLGWKRGRSEIQAGLAPSVTWDLVENHWGYRHVEKTPLDLYRWGSSRDIGISARGSFGAGERLRYHVMLGNGEGTRNETDDGKKVMASLAFQPTDAWTLEVQGDYDNRPGASDRTTGQVFVGYKVDRGRFGVQYGRQTRETSATTELNLDFVSTYGVLTLTDRLTLLGRIDLNLDPIPDGAEVDYIAFDPNAESTFALLGLDVRLHQQINLIPSLEAVFYHDAGTTPAPDDDLIARVTLFAQF